MNIVNKDFVFEIMRKCELPFFTVYDATGQRKLYEQQDETKNYSDAILELDEVIAAQEVGQTICVKISEITKKEKAGGGNVKKGLYEYRIRCGAKQGVGGVKESSIDNSIVSRQVLDLMDQLKSKELEIIQLQNKQAIADLEKKWEDRLSESPLDKYMPAIISGLSGLMGQGAPKAAIQGIAGPEVEQPKEDINAIITSAVKRLYKVDKDLPNTLTTLADFAEKDPNKYLSFLPMLKSL